MRCLIVYLNSTVINQQTDPRDLFSLKFKLILKNLTGSFKRKILISPSFGFPVQRPDKRRRHRRVCISGGSLRVLAPGLLRLQHLQRTASGPHLLPPGWQDLLRAAPRRAAEASLHRLRRGNDTNTHTVTLTVRNWWVAGSGRRGVGWITSCNPPDVSTGSEDCVSAHEAFGGFNGTVIESKCTILIPQSALTSNLLPTHTTSTSSGKLCNLRCSRSP